MDNSVVVLSSSSSEGSSVSEEDIHDEELSLDSADECGNEISFEEEEKSESDEEPSSDVPEASSMVVAGLTIEVKSKENSNVVIEDRFISYPESKRMKIQLNDDEEEEKEEEDIELALISSSQSTATSVAVSAEQDTIHHQRIHKLESQRRDLNNQLLEIKEQLLHSEQSLCYTEDKLSSLVEKSSKSIESLRSDIITLKVKNDELSVENRKLSTRLLEVSEASDTASTLSTTTQMNEYFSKLCVAQRKLQESENKDIKLLKANRTIRLLEKKLRAQEEEQKIVSLSKTQLDTYSGVACRNEILEQENKALRQRVGNMELLRYQLQMEREKSASLEEKMKVFNQLQLDSEIKDIVEKESNSSSSLALLTYKLLNVQQREVILARKCGETETELKVVKHELWDLKDKHSELEKELAIEKEETKSKNDSIQRLERRLQFITKEREGCVNVLNSYKLDGGVELVLKEQIKELQDTVHRYAEKISHLEAMNDDLRGKLDEEKKTQVMMSQEAARIKDKMNVIEEECYQLKLERKQFEEMLTKDYSSSVKSS